MSVPHFDFPNSPHIAGNTHDDDAEILDNLVESEAEPPKPAEMPHEKGEPIKAPDPITRIMGNTINMQAAWDQPTQILPADPNRISLEINVNSTTPADVVYFADEKNKAQNASTSFAVSPATRSFSLSGHTGALWAYAPGIAGSALVTVAAVTK